MQFEIADSQAQVIRDEFSRLLSEIDLLYPEIARGGTGRGKRPQFGLKYPNMTNLLMEICYPFTPPKLKNTRL